MENEIIKITDEDGCIITIHDVMMDGSRLVVSVTDEDDIPVGMWLDRGSATVLRDALTQWIGK